MRRCSCCCNLFFALLLPVAQPCGFVPLRRGSNVLAWDTQRAAAAVGPTVQEAIKALGSRELKEGTAPIPLIAITGGHAGNRRRRINVWHVP